MPIRLAAGGATHARVLLELAHMNESVLDEVLGLLEDFRAVGSEAWREHELQAEDLVREGVSNGQIDLSEISSTREMVANLLATNHIMNFLLDQGFEEITVQAIMQAGERGFTDHDLMALEEGTAPSRDTIDEFRIRAFFAHYAMVCDAQQAQALIEPQFQ
jgi:hypothetical protein